MRRHNDVFEFHMAPKILSCTLTSDLEVLLDQSQTDEATQWACDVFLAADGGESSSQGVYCHSHLLFVRCPRLYHVVQEYLPAHAPPPKSAPGAEAAYTSDPVPAPPPMPPPEADFAPGAPLPGPVLLQKTTDEQRPSTYPGADGGSVVKDRERDRERDREINQDETIDSLLRAVVTDVNGSDGGQAPHRGGHRGAPNGWGMGWPGGHQCAWVPVDLPQAILMYLLKYLYGEASKFGRLTADQLYQLFLAAKQFEVPRLAALCERQIKVRLGLDTVLPLMRMAVRDGPMAAAVQEACKHFFLANYHHCTELRECEALDPKLLCELMRLHNSRVTSGTVSQPQQSRGSSSGAPSILAPMSPAPLVRTGTEDLANRSSPCADMISCQIPIPDPSFSQDLIRLLVDEIGTDFEVVVQDEVIKAHKFVLVARSRYFASCILTSGMVEAQAGRLVIPCGSSMTADAFRAFLRFMYAGDDILTVLAPHTAMYLVEAASFYGLTNNRLKYFCENCVKESFNEVHVLQLFEASSRLNVEAVRTMALEFIITHFRSVCRQPALEQLDRQLLIDILKGLAERLPQQPASAAGPGVMPPS